MSQVDHVASRSTKKITYQILVGRT